MDYAVITGDIVASSQLEARHKNAQNEVLKDAFNEIRKVDTASNSLPSFHIFRGDSFQGLMNQPKNALEAAIQIRARLRKSQPEEVNNNWDARIAIGTGSVDYLPENVTEGDGEAYRNSGPVLDNLKGNFRLAIQTPDKELNDEFKALCALTDAVIAKWTPSQAEVIIMLLKGYTPKKMSEKLNISQTAIHYRIKGASWFAIERLLQRYKQVISHQKK